MCGLDRNVFQRHDAPLTSRLARPPKKISIGLVTRPPPKARFRFAGTEQDLVDVVVQNRAEAIQVEATQGRAQRLRQGIADAVGMTQALALDDLCVETLDIQHIQIADSQIHVPVTEKVARRLPEIACDRCLSR